MITVVIPFFQRETGILSRSITSVLNSQCDQHIHVLVVDDDSPISARDELSTLGTTRYPISVIEQPNQGPGGARNTALDNIPEGTRFVAFLDSDDTWTPSHLSNAIAALGAGNDVYFSDHFQLGADISAFKRANRLIPEEHPPISGHSEIFRYTGDMFDQILSGNVIGTSTVVYDVRRFALIRFRTDLKSAGEDYLFWLDLARQNARFCFSTEAEVRCGRGVNVYAGSGWGTDGHAQRVLNEMMYRSTLLTHYPLSDKQREITRTQRNRLRDEFVADCLHRIAKRKALNWRIINLAIQLDPLIALRGVPVALAMRAEARQKNVSKSSS